MRFVCESCRAQYMINDEKVGPKGVKVRCRKCGYVILVKRGGEAQPKGPTPSAADPDDGSATQVLQNPLTSPVTGGAPAETMADLTNPGAPPLGDRPPVSARDALLGDADEDEIGAVFDQVLNSGAHSISKDAIAKAEDRPTQNNNPMSALGDDDDNDDRMSTRVMDGAIVRKLAEESGDKPADNAAQWDGAKTTDKSEKSPTEGEVPQNDWFVAIDEKQTGPLALEKIKEHWDRGEVGPDSLCWRAGFTDWVPLSEVAQLASVLAPRPASKPIVMNAPVGPAVVSVPVESAFSAGGMMKSVRSEVQVPIGGGTMPEETGSWRPSTSLGSLVQDEMAALSRPAPPMGDAPAGPSEAPNGLLDLPPPEEKPATNGRNGHAGASVEPRSRPAPAAPPPANPYVATPGATYSSPGITQYRPEKDRSAMMIWAIVGVGAMLVVTLLATVIFLINRQPTTTIVQQPPPVAVAQPPPVVAQPPPVVAQPPPVVAQPPPTAVAAVPPKEEKPAEPTGPLPPGKSLPPSTVRGTGNSGGNNTARTPRETKVASAAPTEKPEKAPPPEKKGAAPAKEVDDFDKEFGGGGETPKAAAPEKKKTDRYIPPAPGAATDSVKDSLTSSDVLEVVQTYKPALAKCVEEQRKKEPGVSGKLVMTWKIQTSGKTTNVGVQSEEFKSTYMAGCVGGLIKGWVFPKHKTAGDPIVFPFKF